MPTELVNLELEEVSLVDMGDDPLAKVALFKRSPEGNDMENEVTEETQIEDTEKGYKEQKKLEIEIDGEDDEEEMMEEGEDKKPTRKSWKAEALLLEEANKVLLEEVETYKAKVADLEAAVVEKSKPVEEVIEIDGEKIAKSAVPAPILKKLEDMQKAAEAEAIRKRADEVLPNFKGTADQRGKLLKAVGEDAEILELLRAADALFGKTFEEVGKTDAQTDLMTAKEKLDTMVKAYQEEKKVDFYKAYATVTKTAEGKDLLLKSYNEK